MTRKIWIVIIAFCAIVFVNNIRLFGNSGFAGFLDFLITLLIIYRAYRLFKKASHFVPDTMISPSVSPLHFGRTQKVSRTGNINPPQTQIPSENSVWLVAGVFVTVFLVAAYQVVSAGGLNFFVWGDHVFSAGAGEMPVLMWALAGSLFGAVTGSVVIWRKYHIGFRWCLITGIPILSVLLLLNGLTGQLGAIVPRPIPVLADTTATEKVIPVTTFPKRKHHISSTAPGNVSDTATQKVLVKENECVKRLALVSINARGDSVNVYYRTASFLHGPWSDWRSKFIPQQGQFSLTEDGPVKANGLQYYYESRSVFTRSAQNPFTKLVCDEPLVIDTY